MGLQKRFHSIVQYTRRAAPAVLYCLGRAHEMMSRLAQTLSNKVISNYLHSAFVCRFFSCSQALQPTNNHGRSTQQQQQLRDHYNYTLVRFDKIFCLFYLEDKQFVKKPKRIRILQAFHNLFYLMYKTQKKVFENNSCRGEKKSRQITSAWSTDECWGRTEGIAGCCRDNSFFCHATTIR